jgi:hypothetical protein
LADNALEFLRERPWADGNCYVNLAERDWIIFMPNESTLLKEDAVVAESLGDPAWIRIRDLVYQVSGIYQAENKFYLLVSRASRRMKATGARSPREYLDFLTARPSRDAEMRNLLNEITIGETCLFRSLPQIDALRRVVIPSLAEAKKKLAFTKLRFWSAGCSTGEESYTLAMILMEVTQSLLKGWTFDVVATDLVDGWVARRTRTTPGSSIMPMPSLSSEPPNTKGRHHRCLPAGWTKRRCCSTRTACGAPGSRSAARSSPTRWPSRWTGA